jgi:hypothetical protein
MGYKPFSKELYDKNDDAKHLVIKWLRANGISAWVNPDDYGIDLLSDENKSYEVEVKHNWRGSKFPFGNVHFPLRKMKFANANSTFVMLNHERTHAFLVSGESFLNSPVITKSTIYTKNEKFVEVDVSNCEMVELFYV